MTRLGPLATLCALAIAPLHAQLMPFSGTPELEKSLHRLNELGAVLMIAAHPDDERTAVLAYYARGKYMRTAYLSLTRGEGGQNLIGSEQGAQLGIIRTQELLAARKIDGAEQFFTRAIDFGFTKTAEETLDKWGHDRILSDVVWVIRMYRPDVIILGFSGTPADGHGQHQVSAMLGKEAFEISGDPSKFPEQLKYVQPWKARRIVRAGLGMFGRGPAPAAPATPAPQAGRGPAPAANALPGLPSFPPLPPAGEVDTGEYNPILGYSYEELATLSRSMHHSQGTGAMRRPGFGFADFQIVAGEPMAKDAKDPFDGIDTSWNRVTGGAPIRELLDQALREYDPQHPSKTLPLLVKARPLIAAVRDPLARIKLQQMDEAIAECAGVWVEAQADAPEVTPGSNAKFTTTVINRSHANVTLEGASVSGIVSAALPVKPGPLAYNQASATVFSAALSPNQPYSQPYWLARPPAGSVYTVENQLLIGLPDTPPELQVLVRLTVEGAPVELLRPVQYRYARPAEGERTRPFVVVPPVAVDVPEPVAVFPSPAARKVRVTVKANVPGAAGTLALQLPNGWKASPPSQPFRVAVSGEQQELSFDVTPGAGETVATIRAVATTGHSQVASGMQVISYPHFPPQTLFPPSDIKAVRTNVKVTAHKVGYIMGAGDEMPDAIRQLGVEVTLLSASDLAQGDLSRFDAIVAGVRAYNVRPELRAHQPRLMEYVRNGGTYVVQYQLAEPGLSVGPYPITISSGNKYRVTVEESPVTYPHPDSLLLQSPNHINPQDWEGWVQERGLYFATEWDKNYQTVIASHDPGEQPMEGGELWTKYGKGVYILTTYSWFRQLPAGVPGAYRIFANMLSAK